MRLIPATTWTITIRKDRWRYRFAAWLLDRAITVVGWVAGDGEVIINDHRAEYPQ